MSDVIGFPHGYHDRPEPKAASPAATILHQAAELIDGERDVQHGNRHECLSEIAKAWTWWKGVEFTPYDAAMMMALLKIARAKTGEFNSDNAIDGAGYLALGAEVRNVKETAGPGLGTTKG